MDDVEVVKIPYALCEGAGNKILVVDSLRLGTDPATKKQRVRALCSGQSSAEVEADQLLEVFQRNPIDFQVWNRDGSTAAMCGNGARAILHFAEKRKWFAPSLEAGTTVPLRISGADYSARRLEHLGEFAVDLGVPVYESFDRIKVEGQEIPVHKLRVGNPHAVIFCGGGENEWNIPESFALTVWGPLLSELLNANIEFVHHKPQYPNLAQQTNPAGQANAADATFSVLVWELGAGKTLACGSGAVAVAKAAATTKRLGDGASRPTSIVAIEMAGGTLRVELENREDGHASLSGPASIIDDGLAELEIK